MSSGRTLLNRSSGQVVLPHAPEDLIRDPTTQRADGLPLGVARGLTVLNIIMSSTADPHLGNRDSVKSRIELAVAAAVEAVTLVASGPNRDGSAAVVHCELSRRPEPTDACGLANQFRGAECGAAV